MKISDVAAVAGCSVRSIRHLHESGVVAEPVRTSSNHREYSISDLAAVVRARALIDAGVPVADATGEDTDIVVDRALKQLDVRIAHLQQQRTRLAMLAAHPAGAPTDIREALRGVFSDPQAVQRELDAWDLMALAEVATTATWAQLRENLANLDCVEAAREASSLWQTLGRMRVSDWDFGSIATRIQELVPRGLLRGIAPTLQPGKIPLNLHDVPTEGAQRALLQTLTERFDA